MNTVRALGLMAASAIALSACTPIGIATGVGATAGMAAAKDGGIGGALTDTRIQTEISDLWFKYDLATFAKLDLTVTQGRVLITGTVQNPEHRVEAVRLAWQPKGVKQVINEIQIAEGGGVTGFARDAWISGRLRTAMIFNKNIQSVNYTIDTVQGIVYLMGFAQNQAELDRVTQLARTIPDVKRVVSYVKIAGTPDEPVTAGETMPPAQNGAAYPMNEPQWPSDTSAAPAQDSGAPLNITPVEVERIDQN